MVSIGAHGITGDFTDRTFSFHAENTTVNETLNTIESGWMHGKAFGALTPSIG